MNQRIFWTADGVDMPPLDYEFIAHWLEEVAKNHDRMVGPMNYIFCDDKKILEVNIEFLNHDYFTDIITFDYSRRRLVSGDMYISLETVASNASGLGVDYMTELKRVIVHGLLHLCGINDKGEGEREIMEMHENEALLLFNRLSGQL
ncbi:rRNA maturation RNase YbeY [Muribaculaceae bacterium Isolate-104 (HZI)]|jgi:rRNA maturation RNase YbeY|nr:rRNA maturation RNase YbeY [Muribaculaceae bacterium Isolate-104 (HZI)]